MVKAKIHSFESFATLDGDGLRYAIFLMGCPFRCIYCHNPDTWTGDGLQMSEDELLKKIIRYKPYFKQNGGVTFSGGEPLLQAEFIANFAPKLEQNAIKYVIDTSGGVQLSDNVKRAIDSSQMIILDLKFWDKPSYERYCQGDINKVIAIGDYANEIGKKMWLRTVIVPQINDQPQFIDKYLEVAKRWNNIDKYELLGFHTMGFDKYNRLDINNKLKNKKDLDSSVLKMLQDYLDKRWE